MTASPQRRRIATGLIGSGLVIACAFGPVTSARAQDLPAAGKQMRIIVPYAAGGTSDILGRMQDGRAGALAVTTGQRTDLWKGMPTVAEGGVKGFDAGVWYGLYVPAKTPKTTVERRHGYCTAA